MSTPHHQHGSPDIGPRHHLEVFGPDVSRLTVGRDQALGDVGELMAIGFLVGDVMPCNVSLVARTCLYEEVGPEPILPKPAATRATRSREEFSEAGTASRVAL